MKSREIVSRVSELAGPVCREQGVMLWDVTFEKEGKNDVLTVLIDRPEGVFIEDCEKVSRALDALLDAPEFDQMPSYMLAVSSPGLERKLVKPEHRDWAVGKRVDAKFFGPIDGKHTLSGILTGHGDGQVELLDGEEKKTVKLSDISTLRLHFEL